MSAKSSRATKEILANLLRAKGISKEVIGNINRADRDAMRLISTVSQLQRGDVTSLIPMLTGMGPYGVALATALGLGIFAYMVYQEVTKERPTEVYHWRYPT